MQTIITDFLSTEIKSKPYYVRAKEAFFQHQLMIAAKTGQDVYENEYIKLNNLPYATKINGQITIQETFKDIWNKKISMQSK